jgi:uncharacterized HAD superfamily protein
MHKRIAIDIDGVIYDIVDSTIRYLRELETPVILNRKDWTTYKLSGCCNISYTDEKELFLNTKLYNGKPIENSIESIKELVSKGWIIYLITARDFDALYSLTIKWLQEYHVPFHKLIFSKDKISFLKKESIDFFVEDYDTTALEARCNNIKNVYLIDAPYNQNALGITRVKNLAEVVNLVEKEINKE